MRFLGQCAQAGRFKENQWGSGNPANYNLVRCTMTDNRLGSVMEPRVSQVWGNKRRQWPCPPDAPRQPGCTRHPSTVINAAAFYFQRYVSLNKFCGHPKNTEEPPIPCRFCGLELFLCVCGSLFYMYLFLYTDLPPDS